jgi:hypothetical protein
MRILISLLCVSCVLLAEGDGCSGHDLKQHEPVRLVASPTLSNADEKSRWRELA